MKKLISVILVVLLVAICSVSFAAEKMVEVTLSSGKTVKIRESVKEVLDEYEAYYNDTIDFSTGKSNPLGALSLLGKSSDILEKIDEIDDDFTDEETLYYLEIQTKVTQNMILSL